MKTKWLLLLFLLGLTSPTHSEIDGGGSASSGAGVIQPRNLLFNGEFLIDQRKEGAAHTINTEPVESIDMVRNFAHGGGAFTVQRLADTPPSGEFKHYMRVKATSPPGSIANGDYYTCEIYTEDVNNAPLAWGTSEAKAASLQFWARSSLTGTFAGCVQDAAGNRHFVFTYTIAAADTWQFFVIPILPDTGGDLWEFEVGKLGLQVAFDYGGGSTWETANPLTWETGDKFRVAGATNLIMTQDATLDVAGVSLTPLNSGDAVPTSYEHLPYEEVLRRCMRYYEKSYPPGTAPGTNESNSFESVDAAQIEDTPGPIMASGVVKYQVPKAANATVVLYTTAGTSGSWTWYTTDGTGTNRVTTVNAVTNRRHGFEVVQSVAAESYGIGHWTAAVILAD